MSRILFLALVTVFAPISASQVPKKTDANDSVAEPIRLKQVTRGDLVGNMQLLNLGGEQPEGIQRLYEATYKILAASPDSTFADLARHTAVQRLCAEAGVTHFGGPMLGAVRSDGAAVWLRTLRPAKVEVIVTADGQERCFGPVESTYQSDLMAVVPVTGLKPDTRYPYRVLVDGNPIAMAMPAILITAPAPGPAKARIAFGSCFHRWGLANQRQAAMICERQPTALLIYGDIAVQDRDNHLGLHRADYLLRDFQPSWQRIAASVPVYATWDDHDYFNNDKWGIPKKYTEKDRQGVWEVFRHAWNNPSYGFNDDRRGVFLRTRIGPCDVIMVDHRYFRTAPDTDGDEGGNFLGPRQMQWLEKQLLDCQGPFIILSCGTMWSDYVSNGKDSWAVYDPKGREQIFSLIEEHRIPGVLLISGDRHGARVFRIPRLSGYSFYEFEPASLGGRGDGPPAADPKWDTQLFGMAGRYAFGEFTFDATLPDPQVMFRLVHDAGDVLYELKLTRSQLTPPE
jgi:alkaline phosphatase D